MTHPLDLPARAMRDAFRTRELSPAQVMEALIARIEASEPHVAALWAFAPERAMDAARAAEDRYARGAPLGPLDGMPVSLKELVATEGEPVPLGTAAMPLEPAASDSPVAARLREDGAIVYAKTTCPDFGMLTSGLSSFHDLSRNPWNLEMTPGGSSAGAAAAGAAGYGALHVGTDIGGSIRLPAAWCGLFGLKPSLGRVPIAPYYTGRVAGPMTPRVDDAALLMETITRPDDRDATSLPHAALDYAGRADVRGMRIGLMLRAGAGLDPDPEIVAAVEAAAAAFAAHGAEIIPVGPVLTRDMLDGLDVAWRARFLAQIDSLGPEARDRVLPYILSWAEGGRGATAQAVATGFDRTFEMRAAARDALAGLDAILSPVNPTTGAPADHASPTNDPARPFEHIGFTVAWNMGEQPAASVHCAMARNGVPIGVQIVGPRFADDRVMALARAYEEWRGPITDWPRFGPGGI